MPNYNHLAGAQHPVQMATGLTKPQIIEPPRLPVPGGLAPPEILKGQVGVLKMEIQTRLMKQAIYHDTELLFFALLKVDEVAGRISELYQSEARPQWQEEFLRHAIEATVSDLMQSINDDLVDAYRRIGDTAARALSEEDLPGFFHRVLGGY